MSTSRSPAWLLAATRRRAGYSDLRVSDAERTEVADLLAKHYGDGRLDQAEFNQRLDQAMRAKTYRELSGLFADLPPTEDIEEPAGAQVTARLQPRHRNHRILLFALVIAVAVFAGTAVRFQLPFGVAFNPLAWIALFIVIIVLAARGRKHTS